MTTGTLLGLCRELKGARLRDVSEAIGLSISYLSDIEHDRGELTFRTAIKLCRYYGITLQRLAATVDLSES